MIERAPEGAIKVIAPRMATTLVEDIEAVLHKHGVSYKVGGLILEGILKFLDPDYRSTTIPSYNPDLRGTGSCDENLTSGKIICASCHEAKRPTAFAGDSTSCRKCQKSESKVTPKDRILIGISKDEAYEITRGNMPAFLKTNVLARLKRENIQTAYLVYKNKTVAKWSREELGS